MYVYLSKILPLLLMPVTIVLVLSLIALLLQRGSKKMAASLLAVAISVLWVASTPMVANGLYRGLESRYPPQPLAEVQEADCIVLLGGVIGAPMPPRVEADLGETVDRVYKSAQLFRAGKARSLIVTAGNQPWSQSAWTEADLIRDLLVEWGVPKGVIFLEGSSRNTRENAIYSKNLIDSINCKESLLVTSAAHMPRALAAFQSVNASVIPVSTDVRIIDRDVPTPMDFLPSAGALAMTSEAIREWIGQWVYKLQGWG
jgi:uncharacterized SAM-binding protein YcdF (DUF218 family)